MATSAILKIVKSPLSQSKNDPILMKFGTKQQIWNSMTVAWPNMIFFQIRDGGQTPY